MANELITWLWSKSFVLAQIRIVQTAFPPILAIIRAVITRWTAHYLAYRRLTQVRGTLRMVSDNDTAKPVSQIVTGDARAKAKATSMIAIINNNTFWTAITRLDSVNNNCFISLTVLHRTVRYLEPLAIAANITQAAHCHLYDVLLCFGMLYCQYSQLPSTEASMMNGILSSIGRRWDKSDQEIFVASLILHP